MPPTVNAAEKHQTLGAPDAFRRGNQTLRLDGGQGRRGWPSPGRAGQSSLPARCRNAKWGPRTGTARFARGARRKGRLGRVPSGFFPTHRATRVRPIPSRIFMVPRIAQLVCASWASLCVTRRRRNTTQRMATQNTTANLRRTARGRRGPAPAFTPARAACKNGRRNRGPTPRALRPTRAAEACSGPALERPTRPRPAHSGQDQRHPP